MSELRRSQLGDLAVVASWIRSESECRLWCGSRVSFPIDLACLPDALEYATCESWTTCTGGQVVAFGQLVPKAEGRLHLARIISCPEQRGQGLGRRMTQHLLQQALAQSPQAISLNVFASNDAALGLYRSLGFAACARPADEPDSPSIYMQR
jgi:ribosomal protein S18 acetylase RimI-like enzyme